MLRSALMNEGEKESHSLAGTRDKQNVESALGASDAMAEALKNGHTVGAIRKVQSDDTKQKRKKNLV